MQRDISNRLPHFGPGARWRISKRTYCGGLLSHRDQAANHLLGTLLCITILFWLTNLRVLCRQIYGPESSGKTTLALHAIAEIQVFC